MFIIFYSSFPPPRSTPHSLLFLLSFFHYFSSCPMLPSFI
jgi:hypothetical protein